MSPLLLLVIFVLLFVYLYRYAKQRPSNFPPGPPRLPVWGSYWILLLNNYNFLHLAMHKLCKRYRTKIMGFYMGSLPGVVVEDPDLIRQVFHRPEFQGRVGDYAIQKRGNYMKNYGVIFTDGPFWEEQRRFSLRHLRDYGFGKRFSLTEGIVQEELQDMLELLHGKREDKEVYNPETGLTHVPDLYYPLFFNAFWFMLTGQRYPAKEHSKLRKFTRAALSFQRSLDTTGNAIGITPWLRFFPPLAKGFIQGDKACNTMLEFIKETIAEHKDTYSDENERDFMDRFIKEMKALGNIPSTFTNEQLEIMALDYLFPVSTTVTATLTFAMVYLLNHIDVQVKAQKEIDEVVGRDRLPTLDDRPKMPYTEAVLREVMRRETLVPLAVTHRATEDAELGGYHIPKDSFLLVNLWAYHMDSEVWGDPEVFRPERFLNKYGQLLKKDISLPFGAGKRLCAGETFARNNMFLTLATLLQNFTMLPAETGRCPTMEPDLPGVIVTKNDFWLRFQPRS